MFSISILRIIIIVQLLRIKAVMSTLFQMESARTFKIRKTGIKTKTIQQLHDQEQVANLQDLRLADNVENQKSNEENCEVKKLQVAMYEDDEQNINCYRFPHSKYCGCNTNCLLESFQPCQMMDGLYFGNFITGLKSRHLLDLGITHILNVTSKQYTKKTKYFSYLNIDLLNNTEEDAKKFFRLSNRFIKKALQAGGKVLIHGSVDQISAIMSCAYMIGVQKVSLKQCLGKISEYQIEISPHFMKQLEAYDLQKMAFVSIQRE